MALPRRCSASPKRPSTAVNNSLEEPVRHAADTREQPLGIDAQAFERNPAPCKNADEAEAGSLGNGANHIPLNELGCDPAREPDVPRLVPVDAAEDRVGGGLSRKDTIGLE